MGRVALLACVGGLAFVVCAIGGSKTRQPTNAGQQHCARCTEATPPSGHYTCNAHRKLAVKKVSPTWSARAMPDVEVTHAPLSSTPFSMQFHMHAAGHRPVLLLRKNGDHHDTLQEGYNELESLSHHQLATSKRSRANACFCVAAPQLCLQIKRPATTATCAPQTSAPSTLRAPQHREPFAHCCIL